MVKTTKLKLITILNYFGLWNTIKVLKPDPSPAMAQQGKRKVHELKRMF